MHLKIQRSSAYVSSDKISFVFVNHGHTPLSDEQWCLWFVDDIHLDHEVRLAPSFCVGAIYVFTL